MSSTTISKKLFENAEFVSSSDPTSIDHDNLVYMDSDSEGSEKFNYDLHLQQTSLQETVQEGKGETDVAIGITDNLVYPVKQEEECIIDDVPYEVEEDYEIDIKSEEFGTKIVSASTIIHSLVDIKQDEDDEGEVYASTSFGGNSEFPITRMSPPPGMLPPPNDGSEMDDVQFELITDSISEANTQPVIEITDSFEETVEERKVEVEPVAANNSLVDHQYSQPETNNKEFCDDLVKCLLEETGFAENPQIVPVLEKFTELFSTVVGDDQNSQGSLYIASMSKTLHEVKKRFARLQPQIAPEQVITMPAPESVNTMPAPELKYVGNIKIGGETDLDEIDVTASMVSGDIDDMLKLIEPQLKVIGRLNPKAGLDYLNKVKKRPGIKLFILRFESNDPIRYAKIFDYLMEENKFAVIKSENPDEKVKDFYLIPLESHRPLPKSLLPISGPGFTEGEANKPNLILGVIVKKMTKPAQSSELPQTSGPELPAECAPNSSLTQSDVSQQRWQDTTIGSLDDSFEAPGTQDSDEDEAGVRCEVVIAGDEVETEMIADQPQPENENVAKVRLETTKIFEFLAKTKQTAAEVLQLNNDETFDDAKLKLLELTENSLKEYEKLVKDVQNQFGDKVEIKKAEERNKKKVIKELLDLSDFMDSSDSDNNQILNLNRKIQKSGPDTPAIVSSTKEDSDISEMEVETEVKTEVKAEAGSRASSVESVPEKEKNHGKHIDRLLDFAALNNPKPASSRKITKKKLLKKKKKKTSDFDSNLSSSGGEEETDCSSSNEERDTSDEEQQMLLRQNADVRDDFLAESDSSAGSDGEESSFDFSSSDSDDKPVEKKPKKPSTIDEKKEETKDETDNDITLSATEENKMKTDETSTPPSNVVIQSPTKASVEKTPNEIEAVSLVSDDEDAENENNLERSRPRKKIVRLNSAEREIFSKSFLDINGGSNKGASTSSASNASGTNVITRAKTEIVSPSKPSNPQGTIDVSMYENRRAGKDFDLDKMIEKRHFPNEPSVLSSPSAQSNSKHSLITLLDDECISLSSDSDSEIIAPAGFPKRKKMLTEEELQEETKKANKDEDQRVKRLEKKNKALTQMLSQRLSQGSQEIEEELILDYDPKKKITISVHPKLVKKLKVHQREGIKFMYDTCYGSIADEEKTESGCILAHCMGLGKTLQLITLVHTLIMHPSLLNTSRVLVICPKSTISNWYEEFKKWISREGIPSRNMVIAFLDDQMKFPDRVKRLEEKYKENCPVVTLINYEAFRNMVHHSDSKRAKNADQKEVKRLQDIIDKCLLTGPDLVVCDEGHLIKNQTGSTNRSITKIKTRRRIILTGTPVQNNLNEYYSMVDFIKPALLGTVKEFNNLYGTPIKDGQHIDSDKAMIKKMKQRSFILNKKLSKFVQRKEASVLREYLPEKHEYCIFVPLTKVQEDLYEMFLKQNPLNGGHKLLNDYTALRKIWTHPKVLQNAYDRAWKGELTNEAKRRARDDVVENDQAPEDLYDSFDGNFGVKSKWWKDLIKEDDLESLLSSNKFMLLFEILRQCQERNEKVLVFSAFVAVLNVVEEFMRKMHNQRSNPNAEKYGYTRFARNWEEGKDYYRLDGSTKREARQQMIERFNNKNNTRMCCFLISARAGGQGINLTGANRCVILDTSWNPSADQQNIFRIYRLGQNKVCYVYRLIALGTMEEKVYSRSLTKQAMSGRVVDKQQIDRHYSMDELQQLYVLQKFDPSKKQTQQMPADEILQYLLFHCSLQAFKYHDHDSLLENKPDQDLNEDEIKEAWVMYEQESKGPLARAMQGINNGDVPLFPPHMMRPDMVNFNNYLTANAYTHPYAQSFYNPNDYLQSIFNNLGGGYLNNLVPSTALAPTSSSIPSTSSTVEAMSSSLMQNPFSNFVSGKAGAPTANPPKRRQSLSKAKAARMKQFQGESIHRIDPHALRKNSLENVAILPDDDPPALHSFQAQSRSSSNNANQVLNELRKNKTLDVTRNIVPVPVPKSSAPVALQAIQTAVSTAQRLKPVPPNADRLQRLQSASPSSPMSTSSSRLLHHMTPSPVAPREVPNLISQDYKKKMAQEVEKMKSSSSTARPAKANLSYQVKPQTSTANLSQRSSSSNAINIIQKNNGLPSTNLMQRSQSNSLIDSSKTKKPRIVIMPQTIKSQLIEVPQSSQQSQASQNQRPRPVDLSQSLQPTTMTRNILKGPQMNLSQRSSSSVSASSQSSNKSITSSASAAGSLVAAQSKKIVMSPMMSQSARTSAAAPVTVKYVQANAIKQPQPNPRNIRIVNPQLATTSRSVIHEASQNTIPQQRDPKSPGTSNGVVVASTTVQPSRKRKINANLPKGLVVSSSNIKTNPNVTFNNALNIARSLQSTGGTQEVSVLKITKPTTNNKAQQPSTSVIRIQKRQGEPLPSPANKRPQPATKRPNQGEQTLKVTSREELNRPIQDSMSIIEDIVEIE